MSRCLFKFGKANVAANATTALGWVNGNGTDVSLPMSRSGSVTAITVDMSPDAAAVLTAGTFAIQVSVNGVLQTAAGSVLPAAVGTGVAAFPSRVWQLVLSVPVTFAAGNNVGASIVTTAAYAPATLDPTVQLELALTGTEGNPATPPTIGAPTLTAGVYHYPVWSAYQDAVPLDLRVIVPATPAAGPRKFLYLLPVESFNSSAFGDPITQAVALNLAGVYGMHVVVPAFSMLPWYGDHPSFPYVRQEGFLIDVIIPGIEALYPATGSHPGAAKRLLCGFSKSGMGALTLILRHPTVFDAAAAWDGTCNQTVFNAQTGMSAVFATQGNFDAYALPTIMAAAAAPFTAGSTRLWLGGYSSQATWRDDMTACHLAMDANAVIHSWNDGPQRAHSWGSGWLADAAAFLATI